MSKKIMQINITCGVGSTGRISAMLHQESLDQGYDSCFAYSVYEPAVQGAFRIETTLQNYLRRGLNKYMGCSQSHSTPGTKRLIRYIKKQKPDLIHIHNVQQNSVNYKLLFAFLKRLEIPVVYTLHDCWSFTGGCYHFEKLRCHQYQDGCLNCPIESSTDDKTLGMAKSYEKKRELIAGNPHIHVVCVSNWLKDAACRSYMGQMESVQTIYNGIDTNVFKTVHSEVRKALEIPEDRFVVLGVASYWDERKGLTLFQQLRDLLSDSFQIVLVGVSPQQKSELHGIIGVERTENISQLAEYYSMADVFVNLSKEETFGLTTAEALSCGTPGIVFRATANPEIVDEQTGAVVDGGLDEIIEKLKKMQSIGKKAYIEPCRKRAVDRFDSSIMRKNYLDLYRRLLDDEPCQ